jgi:hypothetical protein
MRSVRTLIGTRCAERIRVTSRREAWLDEDGAAAGKPPNQAATLVARSFASSSISAGRSSSPGWTRTRQDQRTYPRSKPAILGKIRAPSA